MILDRKAVNSFLPEYLKNHGVENPPEVEWASPIVGTVQKMYRKHQWTSDQYEEVLSFVLEDILMGTNLDTDKDPYAAGTLADQVQKWVEEGKTAQEIRHIVGSYVYQKAVQKIKRITKSPGKGPYESFSSDGDNSVTKPGEGVDAKTHHVKANVKGLLGKWMALDKPDVKGRKLIHRIEDKLQDERECLQVMWKAYKECPDPSARLSRLKERDIIWNGEKTTLQKEIDRLNVSTVYFVNNKLREFLRAEFSEEIQEVESD